MKSLYISLVLFAGVIALVWINYSCINSLIDYTEKKLEAVPKFEEELNNMSVEEKEKIHDALKAVNKKWKDSNTFLCLSLVHSVSREFIGEMIPSLSYFESGDYTQFLANIRWAKDMLSHIRYDEGLSIGNIL